MLLEQSEIHELVEVAMSIGGTSDYSSVRGELFSGFDSRLRRKQPLKTEDMDVGSLCVRDLVFLNQCEAGPGSPHPLVLWLNALARKQLSAGPVRSHRAASGEGGPCSSSDVGTAR